jgi:transcriptional regulator with XRE-family HTH domain
MKQPHGRIRQTPQDIAIGNRIRQLRLARGMAQTELGQKMGVTFQQVQKYENGSNAVASTRIQALCDALGITPDQLYDIESKDAKEVGSLSNYAIRMAMKLDKLSNEQKRAVNAMVAAFGVEVD